MNQWNQIITSSFFQIYLVFCTGSKPDSFTAWCRRHCHYHHHHRQAIWLPGDAGERGNEEPVEAEDAEHRHPRHLRLRDLPEERVRAVLHQLCQREAAADLHRVDNEGGAGDGGDEKMIGKEVQAKYICVLCSNISMSYAYERWTIGLSRKSKRKQLKIICWSSSYCLWEILNLRRGKFLKWKYCSSHDEHFLLRKNMRKRESSGRRLSSSITRWRC